ncbi:MAG: L-seryl-tRNA(Sec) selenium transferase, partial [Peptococcaceae bacterium]|nr:L-seryl-tRNA(Sec) selenium transferase [Peptococcaceae bacterium]
MEQLRRARLREIPPVNELSQHSRLRELQQNIAPARITECVQVMLNELRRQILAAKDIDELAHPLQIDALADAVYAQLSAGFAFRLQRVVNATGIVLHTNCGRSVLPAEALQRIVAIAGGYANLELNLATGERGSRYWHVEELLCRLTGAEAAMVVNNNAAAVLLVMHALAAGQEVIVSRGELVEVGGAFRIPEVLKAGGAKLVEVGTTNKTRPSDFATAVTDNTALLLKVHTSNYRVVGFTQMVSATELVEVSKATGIPVVEDLGSGTLIDLKCWGLPEEPTVQ